MNAESVGEWDIACNEERVVGVEIEEIEDGKDRNTSETKAYENQTYIT